MTSENCIAIQEKYDKITSNINTIYNIFLDFYGEERVDLQIVTLEKCIFKFEDRENVTYSDLINFFNDQFNCIIVHFPEVKIENEDGASVNVKDLWVKIPLIVARQNISDSEANDYIALMQTSFSITRSTYPLSHLRSDYMHSHCPGVPWQPHTSFLPCCLGNGPIKNTVATLCSSYDENIWSLFVYELSLYVKTESLRGGPYRYLSRISSLKEQYAPNRNCSQYKLLHVLYNERHQRLISDFVEYLLKNKTIPFHYNFRYMISLSYFDFTIFLSKNFIEWFNNPNNRWNKAYNATTIMSVLVKCKIVNNQILYLSRNATSSIMPDSDIYDKMDGKTLFYFKDKPINVTIEEDEEDETDHSCRLLQSNIVDVIFTKIFNFVNTNYGTKQ